MVTLGGSYLMLAYVDGIQSQAYDPIYDFGGSHEDADDLMQVINSLSNAARPPAPPPPPKWVKQTAWYWTWAGKIRTNVFGGARGYEPEQEITIKGVTWLGLEVHPCVIGGMDEAPIHKSIAFLKSIGVNAVRLPVAASAILSKYSDGDCMPAELAAAARSADTGGQHSIVRLAMS